MNDTNSSTPGKPTENLRRGELGAPMYVLSLPEIRKAEILQSETVLETKDGPVTGRPGDIAMTAADGGERYPILSNIFYGTYEVLGQVGNRLIARRLMHVRTAWEVLSPDAELSYGPDRGTVSVARGGWLYQSDDRDFGLINLTEKHKGHTEVGPIQKVEQTSWSRRFERLTWFLMFLPPLMTGIALLGLSLPEGTWGRTGLTAIETGLLLIGAGAFAWARIEGWEMKAAVSAGAKAAAEFQPAAQLLGERKSEHFPQMALWRAAQARPASGNVLVYSPENARTLDELRGRLGSMVQEIKEEISSSRRIEELGTVLAAAAVAAVIGSNIWLIFAPHLPVELFALWLPSLIGAFHALGYHKRVAEQVPLLNEFARQLDFIKAQLQSTAQWDAAELPQLSGTREAALRLLCKVIGQYSQAELRLAIAQHPSLPV